MMEAVRTSETSVNNHFTRQYNPEDNSEHHTRRRENLKSHKVGYYFSTLVQPKAQNCLEFIKNRAWLLLGLLYSKTVNANFNASPKNLDTELDKKSVVVFCQLGASVTCTLLR
jgi:hypothetical protein